jgi:hypothetical protein
MAKKFLISSFCQHSVSTNVLRALISSFLKSNSITDLWLLLVGEEICQKSFTHGDKSAWKNQSKRILLNVIDPFKNEFKSSQIQLWRKFNLFFEWRWIKYQKLSDWVVWEVKFMVEINLVVREFAKLINESRKSLSQSISVKCRVRGEIFQKKAKFSIAFMSKISWRWMRKFYWHDSISKGENIVARLTSIELKSINNFSLSYQYFMLSCYAFVKLFSHINAWIVKSGGKKNMYSKDTLDKCEYAGWKAMSHWVILRESLTWIWEERDQISSWSGSCNYYVLCEDLFA